MAAAGLARPVLAQAPDSLESILAQSGLADQCGFVLVDLTTAGVLEGHRVNVPFPPASVVKIVTSLYALEALGPNYRYETRLIGKGPVAGGRLDGDLVLAGGGDPVLDTDGLGDLLARLPGVRTVTGRFVVATGALPSVPMIDPGQPDEAGYNPSILGVNLNFNRVYLEWVPGIRGPEVAFSAPGERYRVKLPSVRATLSPGAREPLHAFDSGRETWVLPIEGMKGAGSLWLPVRAPGPYVGEVAAGLAAQGGISAGAAIQTEAVPGGTMLAERRSDPAADLLRGMLLHSTNLTAEVMGLRSSQMRGLSPRGLAESAGAMQEWARAKYGLTDAVFVNHSGLSDRTTLTPLEQTRILAGGWPRLSGLLRARGLEEAPDVRVLMKTGTLDFTSALAGYLIGPSGRRLGFAIFSCDPRARAAIRRQDRLDPPGAKSWLRRARNQQAALLRRWSGMLT